MSVAFNKKSGEAGGDGWNLMFDDDRSKYGCRSKRLVWWIGAAAVCLGLLLLTLILCLVAHNTRAISDGDKKFENLIEVDEKRFDNLTEVVKMLKNLIDEGKKYENQIYNLTKDIDVLRDERNQLRINSSALTKEKEFLQSQYDAVVASRDKLQVEVEGLTLNRTDRPCYPEWKQFNNKCYYFSSRGQSKTWEDSRKDCKQRRSDLVIINTQLELEFVTKRNGVTWIGLSDKETENQWKWVDGTDLVGPGFWQVGEPNNHKRNEDCVEASSESRAWNDAPCDRNFMWVCED